MSSTYLFISIAIMAFVTVCLRFLPFFVFRNGKIPPIITYLGRVLPCAIMGMLVVYCLKDVSFKSLHSWLPSLLASASVVGIHIWKRNTLLSIVAGTICFMLLIRII
ncbi:MAG: AzlD domain-containing protein [Bacillota bacterium]|nr:AzlD domain-containing protein [Bacillota bacterium]